MDWIVREANKEDTNNIVDLAHGYDGFLMPYVLNRFVVHNYSNQFMLATEPVLGTLGGAVHYLKSITETNKTYFFLEEIKRVPVALLESFFLVEDRAFIGQVVCPGKGSFHAILEELKRQYKELWCWMSVRGPSYESYKRYGFILSETSSRFWNVNKCGYSDFVLGVWKG